jgi:hypothetical protein
MAWRRWNPNAAGCSRYSITQKAHEVNRRNGGRAGGLQATYWKGVKPSPLADEAASAFSFSCVEAYGNPQAHTQPVRMGRAGGEQQKRQGIAPCLACAGINAPRGGPAPRWKQKHRKTLQPLSKWSSLRCQHRCCARAHQRLSGERPGEEEARMSQRCRHRPSAINAGGPEGLPANRVHAHSQSSTALSSVANDLTLARSK